MAASALSFYLFLPKAKSGKKKTADQPAWKFLLGGF